MTLDTLKAEIRRLSPQERDALAQWLDAQDSDAWDQQIAADYRAGKLDDLIRRAKHEYDDGKIREAP
jgi:hypothetical protein